MLKKYIIQRIKRKTSNGMNRMILVYDYEGTLKATESYSFNINEEAIKPLELECSYTITSEELEVSISEWKHYKSFKNTI